MYPFAPSSSSSSSKSKSIRLFGKQIELQKELSEPAFQGNKGIFLGKKVLTKCDTDSSCRLLLDKELVLSGIKPFLDSERAQSCATVDGARIKVYDLDTNTEHDLILKQWQSNSYVLVGNWMKDFVKRRKLKKKDEIELYWDATESRLNFSVAQRNHHLE